MKQRLRNMFNLAALCVLVAVLAFGGAGKTSLGTEELAEKAAWGFPGSGSPDFTSSYAGSCEQGGKTLLWFILSDGEKRYYLPMECTAQEKDRYLYHRPYKPYICGTDLAMMEWMGGCVFMVNNPDCVSLRITGNAGSVHESIEKGSYPYVLYYPGEPSDYTFLSDTGASVPCLR